MSTELQEKGGSAEGAAPFSVQDISELLRCLCSSASHVAMYAPDHPTARRSIRRTAACLKDILARKKKPISICVADGHILFEGLPVEERNPLVRRLADFLGRVHCHDLFFEPGLTDEEIVGFHTILAQGADAIGGKGGLGELLSRSPLKHIRARESRYIMVGEDERVVNATARVSSDGTAQNTVDRNIADYLSGRILKEAHEKHWLYNEIKDDPHLMARRIVQGMEIAVARVEGGEDPKAEGLGALLRNIEVIGQRFTEDRTGGQETVEWNKAFSSIERELQARSASLASTSVASGFVEQILGVINGLSDNARQGEVTDQFLAGEKGLRGTEHLLRDLMSAEGAPETSVEAPTAQRPDGVPETAAKEPALKDKNAGGSGNVFELEEDGSLASAIEQFAPLLEDIENDERVRQLLELRLREKEEEFDLRIRQLEQNALRRDLILDAARDGVVLWDEQGQIDFINQSAREMLGLPEKYVFRPEFVKAIRFSRLPLESIPPQFRNANAESYVEKRALELLHTTVRNGKGGVVGIVLAPPA